MLKPARVEATEIIECPYSADPVAQFEIKTNIPVGERNRLHDLIRSVNMSSTASIFEFNREIVRTCYVRTVQGVDFGPLTLTPEEQIAVMAEIRLPGSGFENLINWLGSEIWQRVTLAEQEKNSSGSPSEQAKKS